MKKLRRIISGLLLVAICVGWFTPLTVEAAAVTINGNQFPSNFKDLNNSLRGSNGDTFFEDYYNALSSAAEGSAFSTSFNWNELYLASTSSAFDIDSGGIGVADNDASNLAQRLAYAYAVVNFVTLKSVSTQSSVFTDNASDVQDTTSKLESLCISQPTESLQKGSTTNISAMWNNLTSGRDYVTGTDLEAAVNEMGTDDISFKHIGTIGSLSANGNYVSQEGLDCYNTAIYACLTALTDYVYYATEWRETKVGQDILTSEDKSLLVNLKLTHDALSSYFPILDVLWELKDPNNSDDKSLKELCEENDVGPTQLSFETDTSFTHVVDDEDVIGYMYKLNSADGIAGIEFDSIVDDVDVNVSAWDDLTSKIDEYTEGDDFLSKAKGFVKGVMNWANIGTLKKGVSHMVDAFTNFANNSDSEVLEDAADAVNANMSSSANLNEESHATDYLACSLSDYIVEGMTYSSTYVPLKSNVYLPQTIKQYDEEFRDKFFYKYGFMRKALYIDTSGSAVTDYYNSSGQDNTMRKVCTLRDLVENDGNEVLLYVDTEFYNSDVALAEGNKIIDEQRYRVNDLYQYLHEWVYACSAIDAAGDLETNDVLTLVASLDPVIWSTFVNALTAEDGASVTAQFYSEFQAYMLSRYNFDIGVVQDWEAAQDLLNKVCTAMEASEGYELTEKTLKAGDYSAYDSMAAKRLTLAGTTEDVKYRHVTSEDLFSLDNWDSIVLPSSAITDYFFAETSYSRSTDNGDGTMTVNYYSAMDPYSPMLSLAWVSAIYRDLDVYTVANVTASITPVFMASDQVCEIAESSQWYKNTILNWLLLQNLKSAAPLDYTYACDLDCPVYVDIFGNILSEGGLVVIPAAANATLHCASFHENNVAVGSYVHYGNDYFVPIDKVGAYTALDPFFYPDIDAGVYIINGTTVSLGGKSVRYDTISPYNIETQEGVMGAYKSYLKNDIYTCCNWPAMVNIINEVMRGAPIENIDKDKEGLYTTVNKNKAAIVAAAKLETLVSMLKGAMENTLLCIPDFSRMDDFEYVVAFFIKIMLVMTAGVIIVIIYRDGAGGNLGFRTFWKSFTSVLLTFAAICVIPAVFQLTYYAANKYLLHDECMRILMLNTEKRESGIEIGMVETYTPDTSNDMAIQLDWITVPWYDQLENMLWGSTLKNLDKVKLEAYSQVPTYNNPDVVVHNDGVYITTDTLFDSVRIDYAYDDMSTVDVPGLYLYSKETTQTASYYSPYYVFLYALTANVNEYNYYHDCYNYSTKMMSGNVMKTVGLCEEYFTSKTFMEIDTDILHLYEVYDMPEQDTYDRIKLWDEPQVAQFQNSLWWNNIDGDGFTKRVELVNKECRDFVADNKDMLSKVSDETFLKVMALNCAIKYNQLFGITSANALEIYNMDSNDLLRLSIVKPDDAVLAAPLSYARYVYEFGGEPAVYAASILTMIMWLGSFIKPLCTIIVFISVFLSIWVFRVLLRKPSANLLGYLVTVGLLCGTNILHAVLLKVSIYLPNMGLSALGCLIFLIFTQVCYLLVLGYVTGVSLKDWQNLGATEYEREARLVRSKMRGGEAEHLSGAVKHYDDGWQYYDDLVQQHRSRNA